SLCTPEPVDKGELAVFDPSDAAIEFETVTNARFVLGTAIPHPHDLHLGHYSVHTSPAALIEREREISRIGRELSAKGVLFAPILNPLRSYELAASDRMQFHDAWYLRTQALACPHRALPGRADDRAGHDP